MAWTQEYFGAPAAGEGAEKALRLPMGMASPLWAIYAAAAGAGVAYWWMTGWTRAVNVEAFAAFRPTAPVAADPAEIVVEALPDVEIVEEVAADVAFAAESVASEVVEAEIAVAESAPEATPAVAEIADDLTRLSGIGPKLSIALAERGIRRFADIAAWTGDDLARFDAELSLKGRAVREAWVAQAKRLAAAG
jgi:predicted flap endonuclease-1-like 5' DNA nuclease